MILSVYPDYGTARTEYCAAIIQVLRTYPASVFPALTDLRHGIPGRCRNLPTVADIVAFADEVEQRALIASAPVPKNLVIEAGTPDWEAWTEHRKGRSLPITDVRMPDGRLVKGWWVPSKRPPVGKSA